MKHLATIFALLFFSVLSFAQSKTTDLKDEQIARQKLEVRSGGILKVAGYEISGISNDPTLADSLNSHLVTEAAAKAYANTKDPSTTNELTTFTSASSAPSSPKTGDIWHKSTTDSVFIRTAAPAWAFLAIRASGSSDPAMGGDLSGTASNAQIVANAVGSSEIATGAVTTTEILDATVAWADLAQAVKDSINAGGSSVGGFRFSTNTVSSGTATLDSVVTFLQGTTSGVVFPDGVDGMVRWVVNERVFALPFTVHASDTYEFDDNKFIPAGLTTQYIFNSTDNEWKVGNYQPLMSTTSFNGSGDPVVPFFLKNRDAGDIDVVAGEQMQIDTGAVSWVDLSQAVKDTIGTYWKKTGRVVTSNSDVHVVVADSASISSANTILSASSNIYLNPTGELILGNGSGTNTPTTNSDHLGMDLGYDGTGVLVGSQKAAKRSLSGSSDPVNGSTVAWYIGQLYTNTTSGDIFVATTASSNPDLSGAGSTWGTTGTSTGAAGIVPALPYPYARVIVIGGQSNANGEGLNADLSAGELAAQTKLNIWNAWIGTPAFQPLDIGTNNHASQAVVEAKHGIEAGLIAEFAAYYPNDTIYLIKYGHDGTDISFHSLGGTGYDSLKTYYVNPALKALQNAGRIPYIQGFFWWQGETVTSDDPTNALHFSNRNDALRAQWRSNLCAEMPWINFEIKNSATVREVVNDTYLDRASKEEYTGVVRSRAFGTYDASHFTTASLKLAAKEAMKTITTMKGGGCEIKLDTIPFAPTAGVSVYVGSGADGNGIFEGGTQGLPSTSTIDANSFNLVFDGDNESNLVTFSDNTSSPLLAISKSEAFGGQPALDVANTSSGYILQAKTGGSGAVAFGVAGSGVGVFTGSNGSVTTYLPTGSDAIGWQSGNPGTVSGSENVTFGMQSGDDLTTGGSNTLLGAHAGENITIGANNAFFGKNTGAVDTDPDNNVLNGLNTARTTTALENSTIIGNQAGENSDTLIGCVVVGYTAARNYDGLQNKLIIHNSEEASTTVGGATNPPLIWGDFVTRDLQFSSDLKIRTNLGALSVINASSLFELESTTKGFLLPRMTTTQRNAISTPATGLQVYNTSLNKLNYYNGSAWQAVVDSTTADARFAILGGNSGSITLGSNTGSLHIETDGTRRLTIPEAGITSSTTASKMLTLDSNDSLKYNTVISAGWTGGVTQSGSDTLQNGAIAYGHFQRVGEIVTFTVRVEIALTNTGNANTVYITPPIASDFTTASTDVIGTANMDTQGLSSSNTTRQRALLFADDTGNKIGISFDPVASLAYPENRMYISASGSYIIQ